MAGTSAVSAVYMGLHLSPVFVGGLVVVNAAGLLYTQSPSAAATPEERHTILDKSSKSTDLELQPLPPGNLEQSRGGAAAVSAYVPFSPRGPPSSAGDSPVGS